MKEQEIKKLNNLLEGIEEQMEHQSSLWRRFLRGAIYGFGFLLGTTIIATIVITIINNFIDAAPFINSFFGITPEALTEIIKQQQ